MRIPNPLSTVLVLTALVTGCSLLGIGNTQRDDLENHRRMWQERGPANYQYDLRVGCFCPTWPYPARIVVRADSVHAVLEPETGDTLRSPQSGEPALTELPDTYRPIGGLFDIVDRALDEDYHRLSVRYNDTIGYPTEIDLEKSENATDDEVHYEVLHFAAQ